MFCYFMLCYATVSDVILWLWYRCQVVWDVKTIFSPCLPLPRGSYCVLPDSTETPNWKSVFQHHVTMMCGSMVAVWQQYGSSMAVVWQQYGSDMALGWQYYGSSMAVVWRQCGSSLAVVWWQSGGIIAVVWRQYGRIAVWQYGRTVVYLYGSMVPYGSMVVWQYGGAEPCFTMAPVVMLCYVMVQWPTCFNMALVCSMAEWQSMVVWQYWSMVVW